MIRLIQRMALAAVALIAGGNAFAYDFEVDGVCYNILSETDRTVEIANGVSLCPDGVENASIDIPYSVAYGDQTYLIIGIGENAFSGCYKAKEVHLHENISYIKENAFKGCYYLSRIYCYAAPPTVSESSFDASIVTSSTNVYVVREYLHLYQNDPIWSKFWVIEFLGGESIFQIGNVYYKTINGIRDEGNEVKVYAICDDEYGYTPQTVEIPEEVTLGFAEENIIFTVTAIGGYINNCSRPQLLTSIILPNTIKEIDRAAFVGLVGLTSVTIPSSVTSIGEVTFYNCTGLTSVTIPESVTSIGEGAFYNCTALKEVHISDLSAWCRINFNFEEVFSSPLMNSEANLYLNGELLVDAVIPDDFTEIKDYTFAGCRSLASITIPESVTSIGEGAFYDCTGLTSVTIPESVTSIGKYAFQESGLISVTIPSSVTSIGNYAFSSCTDLRVAMIGEHVESIGYAAFCDCDNLEEVYSKALNPPALSRIWTVFNAETYKNAILYVPSASMEAYKADSEWGRFSNIRGMETSGVAKLDKDKVTVTAQDGRIVVDGADGAMVEVYDLNGRIVYNGTNEEMPSFAAGFYIVKVAGQSFKVVL